MSICIVVEESSFARKVLDLIIFISFMDLVWTILSLDRCVQISEIPGIYSRAVRPHVHVQSVLV